MPRGARENVHLSRPHPTPWLPRGESETRKYIRTEASDARAEAGGTRRCVRSTRSVPFVIRAPERPAPGTWAPSGHTYLILVIRYFTPAPHHFALSTFDQHQDGTTGANTRADDEPYM